MGFGVTRLAACWGVPWAPAASPPPPSARASPRAAPGMPPAMLGHWHRIDGPVIPGRHSAAGSWAIPPRTSPIEGLAPAALRRLRGQGRRVSRPPQGQLRRARPPIGVAAHLQASTAPPIARTLLFRTSRATSTGNPYLRRASSEFLRPGNASDGVGGPHRHDGRRLPAAPGGSSADAVEVRSRPAPRVGPDRPQTGLRERYWREHAPLAHVRKEVGRDALRRAGQMLPQQARGNETTRRGRPHPQSACRLLDDHLPASAAPTAIANTFRAGLPKSA